MKRLFEKAAQHGMKAIQRNTGTVSKSVLRQLLKEQKVPSFEWKPSGNPEFPFRGKLELNFTLGIHADYPETPLYTVYYEDPTTKKAVPIMHINDMNQFVDDPLTTPPDEQDAIDAKNEQASKGPSSSR